MSINLSKGQGISLTKEAPGINYAVVGLGWDINRTDSKSAYDLDASVFMLGANKKIPNSKYFIFYNNLESPDGSLKSLGDNRTGEGEGDDETIQIDLNKVDSGIAEILFVVTIHEANMRGQNFGQVKNSYICICDKDNNKEIARYELDEDFSTEASIEFGRLYKDNGEWRFEAVGVGYSTELQSLVDKYTD